MSKDFRIKQLRTTQIIASGSSVGASPSLLLYSASAATNIDGGLHADLLSGAGTDVWMFVSGAKNDSRQGNESHASKVLFAGDVVISGTLYAEKQVMEVDMSQNSDLFLSGAVVLGDQGAAGADTGQARLSSTIGANSGSIFVSTGSLYVGRNISGAYSEIKILPTAVDSGNGIGKQDLDDLNRSLHLDINNLSGSLTNSNIASGDLIAVADVDATNAEAKKITLDNFAAKLAGTGLANTSGVVSLNIDGLGALGGTGIHQTADHFVFSDNGTEKKITFSNLEDAIFGNVSGDATIAAGGAITIGADAVESGMLNDNIVSGQVELAHADIADADELLISDAGAIKRVGVDSLRDHFFGVVSGDAAIADGGALTIQATSVEGTMLNTNVADTSTIQVSSNTLSVLKVPNALTAGTGIDAGGTFDGAATRTISVANAQTTIQSVNKDDFTTLGRAGSANDLIDFGTAGSVKVKTNNTDRVTVSDSTTSVSNTLSVTGDIQHDGDTNTKISFLDDQITLTAGNISAIDIVENGASSAVVINESGDQNLDFRVESDNQTKAIFVNAGLDYVSVGADTGVTPDVHFFVSGTIGGITDGGVTASGVSVFGGDVVISGSLLDSGHNKIKLNSIKESGTFTTPPNATGTNSVAIGNKAVASGNNSLAMGTSTTNTTDATGIHSLAIGGDDATASGQYASAIGGYQNTSSGNYSVTMGRGNTASGEDAIAIGKSLSVGSTNTIALGNNSDNATIQLKGTVETFSTLTVPSDIIHSGDTDTKISFGTNEVTLTAGNQVGLKTTVDQAFVLASTYAGNDTNFYVAGTAGSKGDTSTTKGTAVFAGDAVISGSLFFDNNLKIFKDGNDLKFDDGVNSVKTLTQLATVGISDESTFFQGVHAGSNNAKMASSASVSFAGTQGVAHFAENVGSDVYLYVSGGLRSDTGAFGRTTSVFAGATVFSGSATYLGDTVFSVIEATTAVKTPKIQDETGAESIRINTQKVAVGNAINANPTAIFEAPLADNTQAATTNETSHFNVFLNNRSVQTNAFAGIAFDVSTEVDPDSIGAAIRAERDTSASTNAANHDANLTFSTNNAGDDGLTERMRITHDGKVGIGVDPDESLHISGDLKIGGDDIKDSGGNTAISFDGSGAIDNSVTFSGTAIPVFSGNNGVKFANDLIHDGDTDTKIRFFADEISFEAGGIAFLRLDETTQNQVVFNEASADIDFRVESNNEDHMLFVDGGTDRIGMGIAAPSTTLEIKGAAADETALQIKDSQSSDVIIKMYHANGADDGIIDLYTNGAVTSRINANGLSMLGGDGTAEPGLLIVRRDSSTTANDLLGGIGFDSSDGNVPATILNASAFIAGYAAEDHSANDKGGYLVIGTSAIDDNDDVASTEQLRVGSDGLITLAGSLKVGGNIIQNSEGTTTITMDADEDIIVAGDIQVGGGILEGPTDGALTIKADTDIIFKIDADNDGTETFQFQNGGGAEIASLSEIGGLILNGDLTLRSTVQYGNAGNAAMIISDTAHGDVGKALTITAGKPTAGTTNNIAGGALTFQGGQGKGTGAGGDIIFQTANAGGSGSSLNAHATALTISDDLSTTTAGNLAVGGNITSTDAISISVASGDLTLETTGTNSDIVFKVDDNNNDFTALTVDGSAFGSLLHTPLNGGYIKVNDTGTDGFTQINGNGSMSLSRNIDSASSAAALSIYKSRGNESSQTALALDDIIGIINFYGFDTAASLSAQIKVLAAAEHGTSSDASDSPGKMQFLTVPDGTSTSTLALEIGSDQTSTFSGKILPSADDTYDIGSTAAAWQDLYLEGDIYFTDAGTIDTTGNLTIEASGDIKFTHDATQRIQIEDTTGDVAIGSHDPTYRLDVQDSTTSFVANFENTNTGTAADVLRLKISKTGTLGTGNSFIDLIDGDGDVNGRIRGNGSGGITYSTSFTGQHPTSIILNENISAGMIVESTGEIWSKYTQDMGTGIPKVAVSTSQSSKKVFGVIANLSGSYEGMVKASNQSDNETHIEVNSIGEGLVWVTNIGGSIENGDYITSSGIYGLGQKQSDDILRSCTVAKCTENIDWDNISDTIEHNGDVYKKYLTTCTYHCG